MIEKLDSPFLFTAVELIKHHIHLLSVTRYPGKENDEIRILFVRNFLVNLVCNFVLALSNEASENSFERNIQATLKDIQQWADTYKKNPEKIMKEAH